MSQFIVPLSSLPTISSIENRSSGGKVGGLTESQLPFADVLQNAMQNVASTSEASQATMYGLATGQNDDMHTGAIAALKYSTAVSFTTGVASSVIRAYNELIKMQV